MKDIRLALGTHQRGGVDDHQFPVDRDFLRFLEITTGTAICRRSSGENVCRLTHVAANNDTNKDR